MEGGALALLTTILFIIRLPEMNSFMLNNLPFVLSVVVIVALRAGGQKLREIKTSIFGWGGLPSTEVKKTQNIFYYFGVGLVISCSTGFHCARLTALGSRLFGARD